MRSKMPLASSFAGRTPLRLALITGLAVSLGGCIHTGPYPGTAYSGYPQQVAHMPVPPRRALDMEDDGIPVQRPPLRRETRGPDDPREPWSPNYGPPPAAATPQSPPKATPIPFTAPAPTSPSRRAQAPSISRPTTEPASPAPTKVKFDADAIIAKAIAMHEVYNP